MFREELQKLRKSGLYRELRRIDSPQGPRVTLRGKEVILLASNNYLGLANHPQVVESAQQAMQQPEPRMAPAGQISRGQIQDGDYMSLLNPQQGSVIRPQPISLLG